MNKNTYFKEFLAFIFLKPLNDDSVDLKYIAVMQQNSLINDKGRAEGWTLATGDIHFYLGEGQTLTSLVPSNRKTYLQTLRLLP